MRDRDCSKCTKAVQTARMQPVQYNRKDERRAGGLCFRTKLVLYFPQNDLLNIFVILKGFEARPELWGKSLRGGALRCFWSHYYVRRGRAIARHYVLMVSITTKSSHDRYNNDRTAVSMSRTPYLKFAELSKEAMS